MPTQILKSIKGKTVRLTRLDECGAVVEGSCTTLVSDCFVQVVLTAEIEAGDEFVQKSAWGDLCIVDKDPDRIKWVNVTAQFAELNPDALDILTGSTPIVVSGDTIGGTWGQTAHTGGFALEVWTKRTGSDATCSTVAPEWGYFLVPFVRNGRIDGDLTIENGILTVSVNGQGFPSASWLTGPYASNPLGVSMPTTDLFGYSITTVQPPSDTAGCEAYVAP